MSTATTTFDVLHVRTPAMPRGAWLAAQLFTRAAAWLRKPAAPLSRAAEAAQVREFAYGLMKTDPGFAADLFAAADRHESLDD
jgi:hypothetical protein